MKKLIAILGFVLAVGVVRSFAANNTSPIYSSTADIQGATLAGSIANTADDGSGTVGTTMVKVFQADATHGSYVNKIRISPAASTSATMTASVIRLYVSSTTSGTTLATNTFVFHEVAVAALTPANASNSVNFYEIPCNFALNAGWVIYASIQANLAANTRWQLVTFGGDF